MNPSGSPIFLVAGDDAVSYFIASKSLVFYVITAAYLPQICTATYT